MLIEENISPLVAAVIVNWNGKDEVLECLDSLTKLNYLNGRFNLTVVDNASADGSVGAIAAKYPDVKILRNDQNLGYVRAVNRGVRYCLAAGADYIWVLNNDVVVEKSTLEKLIVEAQVNKKAGLIAPVIYDYYHPQTVNNCGYTVNFWTGRLRKLRINKDIFLVPKDKSAKVDTILGCANLISARVFKKIGFLRPVYELYFEETDFNIRARASGFEVVVVKDARVWHKEAATMNKLIWRRAYLLLRNLFIFELLNAKPWHLLVFLPYYFFIHIPYFLIRGSVYGLKIKLPAKRK
jgi:GT2 family glycosyltransferase